MPCSLANPCGGALWEDTEITATLRASGILDRTVYRCLNAHHFTVGAAVDVSRVVCQYCREMFVPLGHTQSVYSRQHAKEQRYCSLRCRKRQREMAREGHAKHSR